MFRATPLILTLLILCLFTGCRSLTISMNDGVPPTFILSASRYAECCRNLDHLFAIEIADESKDLPYYSPNRKEVLLWKITPRPFVDTSAEALPPITYGVVPNTFVQDFPANNVAPSALVEGKIYEVSGSVAFTPEAYVRFTIRNGRAIQLKIPGK